MRGKINFAIFQLNSYFLKDPTIRCNERWLLALSWYKKALNFAILLNKFAKNDFLQKAEQEFEILN